MAGQEPPTERTDLDEWRAMGLQAEAAVRARSWAEADEFAAAFCRLRPDWPKGYLLRQRTMTKLGCDAEDVAEMLRDALGKCAAAEGCGLLREALGSLEVGGSHSPVKFKSKVKGLKLLPHELALVEQGQLVDATHQGASAVWLSAESRKVEDETLALVYRPMGDSECSHLLEHGVLPDTQPYQTIVAGEEGRVYAEKYLRGHKSVDSSPTTVVEFAAPKALVDELFATQSKNEDGAISHGLGSKGGRGLPLFNSSLQAGQTTFRIVCVKRFAVKAVGAFGANRRRSWAP